MLRRETHSNTLLRIVCWALVLTAIFAFPVISLAKTSYDLVIHYISTQVKSGGYGVDAYFSVLDQDKKLVKGIEKGDLTITEDGVQMTIDELKQVTTEPLNIVLAIDISGNSVRVADEREAAIDFVKNLERDDAVGVISFHEEIKTEEDITTEHDDVEDRLKKIKSVSEAGNCLYDAAYEAVKQIAKQPAGRRAVIVMTDGEDKQYKSSKECSSHTDDDVIDLATAWNTRVPIYTIGITKSADEKALKRMAEKTGGRYKLSENSGDIKDALNDLSNQFQNEYIITYTSPNGVGTHPLVIEVDRKSAKDEDTRTMEFVQGSAAVEEPPPTIAAAEPAQEAVLPTLPAEITLPTVAAAIPTLPISIPTEEPSMLEGMNPWMLAGIGVIVGVIVLLIIIVSVIKRVAAGGKKKAKGVGRPPTPSAAPHPAGSAEATVDGMAPVGVPGSKAGDGAQQVGTLTVLASDDPAMIGKVLIVNAGRTTIGRSSENDIVMPGDKAVSREHAMLELSGSRVFLAEIVSQDANRTPKRPTYGTFINESKVEGVPVEIKSGDEIRLGTRCRMRFEKLIRDTASDSTVDEIHVGGIDATLDGESGSTVEYKL